MLLIDLTHTSHTHAKTGIQRVSRSILEALGRTEPITPICYDPYAASWRGLNSEEAAALTTTNRAASKRGAKWPLKTRVLGRCRRFLDLRSKLPASDGLIVPEVFLPKTANNFRSLFSRINGPKIALFHDAIALKFPELSPPKTVGRFPAYLQELSQFDGIAAISNDSNECLRSYWKWLGLTSHPPITTISLGIDLPATFSIPSTESSAIPTILSVGTIEGRKNHLALLNACESLWESGLKFQLHFVGMTNVETGRAATERMQVLKTKGRPIRYDGPVGDAELATAYHDCLFMVYPSLIEGFGLPVQESLIRGIPAVCSARGALGESASGGGCLALDRVDAESLASAIGRLLNNPSEMERLREEITHRTFKSWRQYAQELTGWMATLNSRKEK